MISEIRRATANDVALFYSGKGMPQSSVRAVVIEVDGQPKVIGGVALCQGGPVAFMNMTEDAVRYPKLILKATKKLVDEVFSLYRCPIYAFRDASLESSLRYLTHIGFRPVEENSEVFVWRWQSQS